MHIGEVTVSVKVNKHKSISILNELISEVSAMKDLIPEWSKLEADKIEMSIYKKLESLIYVDQNPT